MSEFGEYDRGFSHGRELSEPLVIEIERLRTVIELLKARLRVEEEVKEQV